MSEEELKAWLVSQGFFGYFDGHSIYYQRSNAKDWSLPDSSENGIVVEIPDSHGGALTVTEQVSPNRPITYGYARDSKGIQKARRDIEGMLVAWDERGGLGAAPVDPNYGYRNFKTTAETTWQEAAHWLESLGFKTQGKGSPWLWYPSAPLTGRPAAMGTHPMISILVRLYKNIGWNVEVLKADQPGGMAKQAWVYFPTSSPYVADPRDYSELQTAVQQAMVKYDEVLSQLSGFSMAPVNQFAGLGGGARPHPLRELDPATRARLCRSYANDTDVPVEQIAKRFGVAVSLLPRYCPEVTRDTSRKELLGVDDVYNQKSAGHIAFAGPWEFLQMRNSVLRAKRSDGLNNLIDGKPARHGRFEGTPEWWKIYGPAILAEAARGLGAVPSDDDWRGPTPPVPLTWDTLRSWLNENLRWNQGDIHYAGRGWWYPDAAVTINAAGVESGDLLPGEAGVALDRDRNYLSVEEDRADYDHPAMFVSWNFGGVSGANYRTTPEEVKADVEQLLMRWDSEGLGGGLGAQEYMPEFESAESATDLTDDIIQLLLAAHFEPHDTYAHRSARTWRLELPTKRTAVAMAQVHFRIEEAEWFVDFVVRAGAEAPHWNWRDVWSRTETIVDGAGPHLDRFKSGLEATLVALDGAMGLAGLSGIFPTRDRRVGKKVYVPKFNPPITGHVHSATGDWLIVRRDEDGRLFTIPTKDAKWDTDEKVDGLGGVAHPRCPRGSRRVHDKCVRKR